MGKSKGKILKKSRLVICVMLVLFFCIYLFFTKYVNPVILSTTQYKVQSLMLKAVNSAVSEVMSDNVIYDDLIKTVTNENGDITMIQANSVMINRLSKELVRESQNNIEKIGDMGVDVPIGTFSGVPILVGRGPDIKLRLLPIGSISADFTSSFSTAGINQTNHRIYINVVASVGIVMPLESKVVSSTIQVLVCESLIVGKIPETYLMASDWSQTLDLIPS